MSEHTDWMIRQRRLVSGKADGLLLQSEARMSEIKLPPLPSIPVGDRFKDALAFRQLGSGGGHQLYECWDEAIHAFAAAYARQVADAERERCAEVAESFRSNDRAVNLTAHEIITGEVAESIAAAIRNG